MADGIAWFESLCQELARNPRAVSAQYDDFRNSAGVLTSARLVLLSPSTSALAKFYAINAVQYALMMRWEALGVEVRRDWMTCTESMVLALSAAPQHVPAYLGNKLLQLHVNIYKRAWLELEGAQRAHLLELAWHLLGGAVGSALLTAILEAFSSAEHMQSNAFIAVREHFQQHLLGGVFDRAVCLLGTPEEVRLLPVLLLLVTWGSSAEEGEGVAAHRPAALGLRLTQVVPRLFALPQADALLIQICLVDREYCDGDVLLTALVGLVSAQLRGASALLLRGNAAFYLQCLQNMLIAHAEHMWTYTRISDALQLLSVLSRQLEVEVEVEEDFFLLLEVWAAIASLAMPSVVQGLAGIVREHFGPLSVVTLRHFVSACEEGDTSEEVLDIDEGHLVDVLSNLAAFGRMNITSSLTTVLGRIPRNNNIPRNNTTLEDLRLTLLLLTYLLVDEDESRGPQADAVISPCILSAWDDQLVSQLVSVVATLFSVWTAQLSPHGSPAIVEVILSAFTALLPRYIDPLHPLPLQSTGAPWDSSTLHSLLALTLTSISTLPHDHAVTTEGCRLLNALALSSERCKAVLKNVLVGRCVDLWGVLGRLGDITDTAVALLKLSLALQLEDACSVPVGIVHSDLSAWAAGSASEEVQLRALALMTALCRAGAGPLDQLTLPLIRDFLQLLLSPRANSTTSRAIILDLLKNEWLKPVLAFLLATTEEVLLRLPEATARLLYAVLLQVYSPSALGLAKADEQAELLVGLIDLLSALGLKEFILWGDTSLPQMPGSENALPALLLHLLAQLNVPEALIRDYTQLADRYLSLLLYLATSSKAAFLHHLQAANAWQGLLQCLLSVVNHTTASIARMALSLLQLLGGYQFDTPQHAYADFVLQALLRMLLSGGCTVDRQDAFANTLVTYFILSNPQIVQTVLIQDLQMTPDSPAYAQYMQHFAKLTTDRGVLLQGGNALKKANRQLFVMNFREFMTSIKALRAVQT